MPKIKTSILVPIFTCRYCFDAVFAHAIFEHLQQPALALQEN